MKKKLAIGITALLSSGCLFGGVMSLNAMETVGATDSNLWMEKGASVRLSEPTGIGFITRIDYEYYESLSEKDVVTGTIILPTDYLTANSITTITHATLNEFGADGTFYQDIENDGFKNEATAETDGYYEYRGSLAPLNVKNYDRAFSAVGYIGVKEVGATEYVYEYTSYSEADHSRAVEDVAFNAYVDRTETEQTVDKVEYKYAVSADGTYSPYTADELTILEGYMRDTTVAVADTTIMQKESGVLALSDLETTIESADANFDAATFGNVTRNNKTIVAAATEATEADVSLNGIYNIEVNGTTTYEATGAKIPATMTVSVDVWSEKTKNVMIAPYDFKAIGGYSRQCQSYGISEVLTETVGEKTGEFYRVNSLGAAVVFGKPLHTKAFYNQWLADNPYAESYINIGWYLYNVSFMENPDTPRTFDRFSGYTQYLCEFNTWFGGKTELSTFLANAYDGMAQYYDTTIAEREAAVSIQRYWDNIGIKDVNGELVYDYILATKITDKLDWLYLTPMTIEIGGMKAIETTELVDRSTVTKITPSLTSDEQKAVDYWTEQGYTISYEFVKRYSDGTPIFTGNDIATLGTYNITETTEDGIYYLNVKATKEDVSGVCLQKSYDIYDATSTTVEYENFKHTDSEYAVMAYAAEFTSKLFNSDTIGTVDVSWFEQNLFYTYNVAFGTDTSTRTAVTNEDGSTSYTDIVYSATYKDVALEYDANTIYMMNFGKATLASGTSQTAISDPYFQGRELGYIEYSWASWATHEKLADLDSKVGTEQGYVITRVLPRHSKAYYEKAQENGAYGDISLAFKGTNGAKTLYFTDISEGKVSMKGWKVGSANNQNVSSNVVGTMDGFIANYDAFADGKVPMFIMKHINLNTSSGAARLYEIGFEKAAN